VGEARVKKGLAVLLNALAQIAAERPAQLVLVGGVRAKDRPILDLFRRQHPDLSIQVTPYLDPEQLPWVCLSLPWSAGARACPANNLRQRAKSCTRCATT
jgi:hypothetical protein